MSCAVVHVSKCSLVKAFWSYTCANHSLRLMPWRKCAARFCASRESWEVCAKAAQESAKTSATATRRVRIFNFLVASVMIPQPAFRDFSPQGEKPIPPAESKQEAGHGRVGATLRLLSGATQVETQPNPPAR